MTRQAQQRRSKGDDPSHHDTASRTAVGKRSLTARLASHGPVQRSTAPSTTATTPVIQLKRYTPGERISFEHNDTTYSGMVIKVKTDSENEGQVVYEVDANMDGDQQSVLVQNGQAIQVESPDRPDIDPSNIRDILGMPVRTLDEDFIEANESARKQNKPSVAGAQQGDVMVGHGILIKHKDVQNTSKPSLQDLARQNFQRNVLLDLAIMATTRSGVMLLMSIESAAEATGKVVLVDFVDGHFSRSNAGQMGSGGTWNTSKDEPGEPANANVGYNPSMLGLPMSVGPSDSLMETQDEIVAPALLDEFGRPKEKPGDVTLFHELVHADDILHGRLYTQEVPSGDFDRSKVSEMHAVGLDEYFDEDFIAGKTEYPTIYSENTYRHERGVALRPWYKDQKETQTYTSELTGDEEEKAFVPVPKPLKFEKLHRKSKVAKRKQQVKDAENENAQTTTYNEELRRARDRKEHDTPEIRASRMALVEDVIRTNREATPKDTEKSSPEVRKRSEKGETSGKKSSDTKKTKSKKTKSSRDTEKRSKKKTDTSDVSLESTSGPYPVFGLPESERRIFAVNEIEQCYNEFIHLLSDDSVEQEEVIEALGRFTTHLDWQVAELQPDPGLRSDFVDHANFHLPRDPESSSFRNNVASAGKQNVEAYRVFVWFTKFTDLLQDYG